MYDSPNADPFCIEFEINQPIVVERYHYINSKIGESTHTSQDALQLGRKLQTKDWSIKVNTSILVMYDFDT